MRRLVLVRHGETLWNREGRYQGQTDIPLSEEGRRQARALRDRLRAHEHLYDPQKTAVVASDLSRAWETADIAFGVPGRPVHRDPELREFRYGLLEGLTRTEIEARHGDVFAEWLAERPDYRIPGGESRDEVRARAIASVLKHLARDPHPYLVAVVHGGVMRQLLQGDVGYENLAAHVMRVDGDALRYEGRL